MSTVSLLGVLITLVCVALGSRCVESELKPIGIIGLLSVVSAIYLSMFGAIEAGGVAAAILVLLGLAAVGVHVGAHMAYHGLIRHRWQ